MNLLPQVSSEDLNQGDLEGGNFAMHEDSCEIQLHLESHVYLKNKKEDMSNSYRVKRKDDQVLQDCMHTFALLIVGDHHKVNRRLGIWFRPDLWALVSFFHFMDSSKPLAFSL